MRWPVSRDVADLRAQLAARDATIAVQASVIERLTAIPVPVSPAPPLVEPREPDPVATVIREQATLDGRTDYELARHLRSYASQLRRDGLSRDQIVGKLVAWQSTESDPLYDKVG